MTYLITFIHGLIGILLHSFVKIKGINERTSKEATIKTIVSKYFRYDFPSIAISIMLLLLWIGFINDYMKTGGSSNPIPFVAKSYQDLAMRFINLATAFFGYVAESVIVSVLGKAEKKIKALYGDENCLPS